MKQMWNKYGTNVEQKWNKSGTKVEQKWNKSGTKVERISETIVVGSNSKLEHKVLCGRTKKKKKGDKRQKKRDQEGEFVGLSFILLSLFWSYLLHICPSLPVISPMTYIYCKT